MGALRKAGVWLGLVEDEDERDGYYDEDYGDDEDFVAPSRARSLARPSHPAADRAERPARDLRSGHEPWVAREAPDRGRRDVRLDRDHLRDPERRDPEPERRHHDERHLGERGRDPREAQAERDVRGDRDARGDRGPWSERDPELRPVRDARVDAAERGERDLRTERETETRAGERTGAVRPLTRPTPGSTALSFPTQDNLALAPQVQLRERAVVSEERARRYQITTLHPTSYSEARAIGEQFRDGHPVIMNLTEMDEPDAKRLVDFAAGLAFGLRGSMERVTNRVFLMTPPNIRVSDEEKARIAEGGFFDQP